jgi:hypothetical protein
VARQKIRMSSPNNRPTLKILLLSKGSAAPSKGGNKGYALYFCLSRIQGHPCCKCVTVGFNLKEVFVNAYNLKSSAFGKWLAGNTLVTFDAIARAAEANGIGKRRVRSVERLPMIGFQRARIARPASGAGVAIAGLDGFAFGVREEAGVRGHRLSFPVA